MPCYSSIATKLTDAALLAEALANMGYTINYKTDSNIVARHSDGARSIIFTRYVESGSFSASGDTSDLISIQRKYAELGVRKWAKTEGYSVIKSENGKMTLVNRRG